MLNLDGCKHTCTEVDVRILLNYIGEDMSDTFNKLQHRATTRTVEVYSNHYNQPCKQNTSEISKMQNTQAEGSTYMSASQATTCKLNTICIDIFHKCPLRPTCPSLVPKHLAKITCMSATEATTCRLNTLWIRSPKHTHRSMLSVNLHECLSGNNMQVEYAKPHRSKNCTQVHAWEDHNMQAECIVAQICMSASQATTSNLNTWCLTYAKPTSNIRRWA